MSIEHDDPRQIDDFQFPFDGSEHEQLAFLLQYAPLAPSHRNSQPWQFRLAKESIGIYSDPLNTRHCSDPKDRQKIIGCGATINTLEIVSAYFGHSPQIRYCIDDNLHKLADFSFLEHCHVTRKATKLFHAIRTRQTNRGDFYGKPLTDYQLKRCRRKVVDFDIIAKAVTSQEKRDEIAKLVGFAVRELYADPWYRREFVQSLRANLGLPKDGIYNYEHIPFNVPAPMINPVLRTVDMSKRVSEFFERKIRSKSPTLILLSSNGDSVGDWLNTGRALNKLLLFLASEGITASFLNYPIEFSRLRNQLAEIFNSKGVPQILLRIGKAEQVKYTGRHPVPLL